MSMDIAFTLTSQWPGELWTLNGDSYDGLMWESDTPKPTEAEIKAANPKAKSAVEAKEQAAHAARLAAIEHAKSLGFTDEMIAVMYPNLVEEA